MTEITTEELKQKMKSGENFVLDLYATWCGPCKVMLNNLQKLNESMKSSNDSTDVNFYKLDIDSDREYVMNELGIRSVPTIKFFRNGQEYHSKVGIMNTTEIMDIIQKQ